MTLRLLISYTLAVCACTAQTSVHIPDPQLKAALEAELWVWAPEPADMLGLTSLNLSSRKIKDLTGLEYAKNLHTLQLTHNQVKDLSPLSKLTNLRKLVPNNNQISDLTPLAGLTNLRHLDIHENRIVDVGPVSGLQNLEHLDLHFNQITDLSPLSNLDNLTYLNLSYNQIRKVSTLSELTRLTELYLHKNQISDISALAGLINLQELIISVNQISSLSALSGLDSLRVLNISSNDISDISSLSVLGNLQRLNLSNNQISDISVLPGMDSLTYVNISSNPLTETACAIHIPEMRDNPGLYIKHDICFPRELAVSSNGGGWVILPGEGQFVYERDSIIKLEAKARPLFAFAAWVDPHSVYYSISNENPTYIAMDHDYQIRAMFVSLLDTLYVDDDALGDLGPGDATWSDPLENGTAEHPFDRIQEAINVAAAGARIIVRPGVYYEDVDFLGKQIELTGFDPNVPELTDFPIIDGSGGGPVVSFIHEEDANSILSGFVLTRGEGDLAGGIYCQNSSPTIANCLIVGNRASDPNGAAVYCRDSNAVFTQCTIVDNVAGANGAAILMENSHAVLINSIVWNNLPQALTLAGTSEALVSFTNIEHVSGPGNTNSDPLFAHPGYWANSNEPGIVAEPDNPQAIWRDGDYHLLSMAGRWNPRTKTWELDGMTSPCIDAGHPVDPVEREPIPHGNTVNMGAYGGTVQGSKSD